MLLRPRAAPTPAPASLSSSSAQAKVATAPFAYTTSTSTTTTTIVTTTTTTQTTTTETKTVPPGPEGPTVPTETGGGERKTGTEGTTERKVATGPALPPSPPASVHGLGGGGQEVGVALPNSGAASRGGVAVGIISDAEESDGEDAIEEHHLPLPQPITRRNTTGSIQNPNLKKKQPHAHPVVPHSAFPLPLQAGFGEGSVDLASDIRKHSEKIRRERNLKRAKQLQQREQGVEKRVEVGLAVAAVASDMEKEPSPAHSTFIGPHVSTAPGTAAVAVATVAEPPVVAENPLVGNLIGEGHVNYVLMYNMLTGIRIAVSRCGGKMMRPIAGEDFRAEHKYSFDIIGNELTPSAKYDFKFKDYSPFVFRHIRESIFHLDPADYLLSLTSKYILSELGSPGKSGSFFYFSRDYRFIIKTIRRSEHLFLRSVLERYWVYVRDNPQTLISRFYGLHRVKLPRGRKIHFVIMNNLFPPHKDIHETYDLKGSTVGREYAEEKARENPRAVLKDVNWIRRGERLDLGPEKRALLTEQLRRDKEFLKSLGVMDYSLLVGIHRMERGNRDRVRRSTLKVFAPEIPPALTPHTLHHHHAHQDSPTLMAARRAAVRSSVSEPKAMRFVSGTVRLPEAGGVPTVVGASGMGRSRSVRIEGELGGGHGQTHLRSLSLNQHRDQALECVDEQVQVEGQGQDSWPLPSSLHQRQVSGSGAGPASASVSGSISQRTSSPTQYSGPSHIPLHTAPFTPTLRPLKTPPLAPEPELEFTFLFYTDEGGLRSTNEFNDPMERIYYLGVIDILTPYGLFKRAESLWKGVKIGRGGRNKISPVPPADYADRFFAFMKAIMTGGEGGEKFRVGGGDYREKENGKERETEDKERGNEEKERANEGEREAAAGGLCGCLGLCRCGSTEI